MQLCNAISDTIKCISLTINTANAIADQQHKNAAIVNLKVDNLMQRKVETKTAAIESNSIISILSIKSKYF